MSICVTIKDRGMFDNSEILLWVKKHCNSYITMIAKAIYKTDHYIADEYEYLYYFSDESDATLFGLRWL